MFTFVLVDKAESSSAEEQLARNTPLGDEVIRFINSDLFGVF